MNYYESMHNSNIQSDYLVPNIVEENLKKEITKKGNKLFELSLNGDKMRKKNSLKYCIELYKILKKEKYDAIHVHGSSSMMSLELLTARIAGVNIRIVHSHNTKSEHRKLNSLLKPIFKSLYTTAFACGQEAGEWLYGKKSEFIIIPNGKKMDEYEYNEEIRNEIREKNNLKDKIVIGHVGYFIYQKNHEYLIDIFNELLKIDKKYQLVLIGDGILMDQIKLKVKNLKIEDNVFFLGQISTEETARWLNAMDIMVFPSRYEGFPNVLIEWQISGLPSVISNTITPSVKITDLVNFMSIEDKPEKWAKKIEKINIVDRNLNKEELKQKVKDVGFDIEENAKKLEEIYINLYNKENGCEND